jgi:hypothetical protein
MRRLIEIADKNFREELGDFFIVSKSRLDNVLDCLEQGAEKIRELKGIVELQKIQISNLEKRLYDEMKTEKD